MPTFIRLIDGRLSIYLLGGDSASKSRQVHRAGAVRGVGAGARGRPAPGPFLWHSEQVGPVGGPRRIAPPGGKALCTPNKLNLKVQYPGIGSKIGWMPAPRRCHRTPRLMAATTIAFIGIRMVMEIQGGGYSLDAGYVPCRDVEKEAVRRRCNCGSKAGRYESRRLD